MSPEMINAVDMSIAWLYPQVVCYKQCQPETLVLSHVSNAHCICDRPTDMLGADRCFMFCHMFELHKVPQSAASNQSNEIQLYAATGHA